jgi:hypothetical protein
MIVAVTGRRGARGELELQAQVSHWHRDGGPGVTGGVKLAPSGCHLKFKFRSLKLSATQVASASDAASASERELTPGCYYPLCYYYYTGRACGARAGWGPPRRRVLGGGGNWVIILPSMPHGTVDLYPPHSTELLQCRSVGLPRLAQVPVLYYILCSSERNPKSESFQTKLSCARIHSYVRVGSPYAPVRMSASKQKLRFTPAQVCIRVCAHVRARVCARARGRVCVRRRL